MNKKSKIFLTLLILTVLMSCFCLTGFAAAAEDGPFELTYSVDQNMHDTGIEDIKLKFSLTNKTADRIENIVVSTDMDKNSTALYGDIANIAFDSVEPGEDVIGEFNYYESPDIVKILLAIGGTSTVIGAAILLFTRNYGRFFAIITTVTLIFTSAFSAFPTNMYHLIALREKQELGSCVLNYKGVECKFNFSVTYEKQVNKSGAVAAKTGEAEQTSSITSTVSEKGKGIAGVIFGADIKDGAFGGYLFYINPEKDTVGIIRSDDSGFTNIAKRSVSLEEGKEYAVKIETEDTLAKCYILNNPLDTDPYPVFEIPVSFYGNDIGTYTSAASTVSTPVISEHTAPTVGETYTNSLVKNIADPYILKYDGVYYLYATNGFRVYSSVDLVNWEDRGVCADYADIYGSSDYWAPEVYYHNGQFYLYYTADQKIAIAVSDSPLGPFKDALGGYLFDFDGIDANLFFDDDGKIYCYVSRNRRDEDLAQPIWVAEMNDDLLSYKAETLREVCSPIGGWEYDVNEGPFMIKHNGVYYMTYSGERYDMKGYSVGYLTSESPLGPFTRYENNPVLTATAFTYGPGHHCFVYSPDDSELFIAYHCHNDLNKFRGRDLAIDRVKFVPVENGYDILTVYGPTVTPQPVPSR